MRASDCAHEWQPVAFRIIEPRRMKAFAYGSVDVVCLKCLSHTRSKTRSFSERLNEEGDRDEQG